MSFCDRRTSGSISTKLGKKHPWVGEGNRQVCSNEGTRPFLRGDIIAIRNLLENHFANFNQIWQKASFGDEDSGLFKFMKDHVLFPGEIIYIDIVNLLQSHWANFNQTWHKALLGDGNSSLIKSDPFPRGDNRKNFQQKNLLPQNHLANFNQFWHKAFLGGGNKNLFKRAATFSKGS